MEQVEGGDHCGESSVPPRREGEVAESEEEVRGAGLDMRRGAGRGAGSVDALPGLRSAVLRTVRREEAFGDAHCRFPLLDTLESGMRYLVTVNIDSTSIFPFNSARTPLAASALSQRSLTGGYRSIRNADPAGPYRHSEYSVQAQRGTHRLGEHIARRAPYKVGAFRHQGCPRNRHWRTI